MLSKIKVRCPACGNEENFSMVKEQSRYDATKQIFVPIEKEVDKNNFIVCNNCGSDNVDEELL